MGDWQQVIDLAEQAREQDYTPESDGADAPSEWIPFIKAYANLGRWQEARQISLEILNREPPLNARTCSLWDALDDTLPQSADKDAAVRDVWSAAGCP
jgi:hypothetical protein